jgi:4'-phosphopantetheinyl transferase
LGNEAVILTGATTLVLDRLGTSGTLTGPELRRMEGLRRAQDRDDFLAAHLLVRACAARLLGVAAGEVSIVQRCTTCGGPHGRPEVTGQPAVQASLAHSRGVVAAAAARVPVGVDVEALRPDREVTAGELSAALTGAEIDAITGAADPDRALLLTWARKEACLKAGLVDLEALNGYDLSALPLEPPAPQLRLRSLPHGRWAVHDWWDSGAGAVGAAVTPAGTDAALAVA